MPIKKRTKHILFAALILLIANTSSCIHGVNNEEGLPDTSPGLCANDSDEAVEELKFRDQNTALRAYKNMQNFFGWVDDNHLDNMPDNYGGSYINENNVFTICVASPDEGSRALYMEACVEPIIIKEVKYSMVELKEAEEAVMSLRKAGTLDMFGILRVKENSVVIELSDDETADKAKKLLKDHPCITFLIADNTLILSEYGESLDTAEIEIIPEFPVYGPDVRTIYFRMHNNTDVDRRYGQGYVVETKIEGQWYIIPFKPGTAWILPAYNLPGNDHEYERINLDILNYKFVPGTYRVVKELGGQMFAGEFKLGESKVTAETPHGFLPLDEIPQNYTIDDAKSDGCVLYPYDMGTYVNITTFLDKIYHNIPAMLRIVGITTEGDMIFTDVEYKVSEFGTMAFFYTHDSTRDRYANGSVTEGIRMFINYTETVNYAGKTIFLLNLGNSPSYTEDDKSNLFIFREFKDERFEEAMDLMTKIEER